MEQKQWATRLHRWRLKNIDDRRFLILLSILIGLGAGMAAVFLRSFVRFIDNQVLESDQEFPILYFLLPAVGMLGSMLCIRFLFGGKLKAGVSHVLFAIGKRNSLIRRLHTYAHVLTSGITVGFGGSVGLEGPIVLTGSAIGSNLGKFFHLNPQKKTILIGCGSAAAISAIFNSPIAGVIFVLEVLIVDLKISFIIPLLISSVTGTLLSKLILGDSSLFEVGVLSQVEYGELPFFVLLGIVSGFISIYFFRSVLNIQAWFSKFEGDFRKWVIGAVILGSLLIVFPILFGEGYWGLRQLLSGNQDAIFVHGRVSDLITNNWLLIGYFLVILFFKTLATGVTKAAGGNGGVFAPSMFLGGITGFVVATFVNQLNLGVEMNVINFTLVGMAGVASGVLHSPLAAIFLIAEITSGYELFVPLMIVAAISYGVSRRFEPHSFYAKQLAQAGDLVVYDKDKVVLQNFNISQVIERDLEAVHESGTLGDLVKAIERSHRNIFPVVDKENNFKGIILMNDVRNIIFRPLLYEEVTISDLMHPADDIVNFEDSMEIVMKKFDRTGSWNLPVVKDGKYEGFLSKSRIFSAYRKKLLHHTREIG